MSLRAFPRHSLIALAAVSLAVWQLAASSAGGPALADDAQRPGGVSGLDWSQVVGPSYAHYQACQDTIEQYLTLEGALLPSPPDATLGADNLACRWDVFAWNSFAALNWPGNTALGKRGLARAGTTFLTNRDPAAEVVWEAFKEKRELFQEDPSPHWNDIADGEEVKRFKTPTNLWSRFGGYCSAADQSRAGTASSGPFAADKFHNQLDETAEVQSQALEPRSVLCQGYDQADCMVRGQSVVGPRVWMGKAVGGRPLYYEVKVNYDFFDYVMHPPEDMALPSEASTLVDDEVAATNAMLNRIRLPWRTKAPPHDVNNQRAVFNYPGGCDPFDGTPETGVADASVPCRTGAVHMKAAWVQLTDEELAESPPRYHTTTALYYETPPDAPDEVCLAVDTFGLLGLHAIQRVMVAKTETDGGKSTTKDSNPGGAFVFATWEHRSILDPCYDRPQDFTYVNLLTRPSTGSSAAGDPYPTLEHALPVTRMVPTGGDPAAETTTTCGSKTTPPLPKCGLSAQQTCQVNDAAIAKLTAAGSVWANYRLVGTQFAPSDCAFTEGDPASEAQQLAQCRYNSLSTLGQPHFLANAVIETNQGLQHFLGLPPEQPRLQPYRWCMRSSSNASYCDSTGARLIGPNAGLPPHFDRGAHNMTYGQTPMNMGGCQGCHGVAQQNGYSFSFVLLDGVGGAKADTEDDADIPATAIAQSVPVWLQSLAEPTEFLAITGPNATFPHFYDLGLTGQDQATQWRLRPYTGTGEAPNFGGRITVADAAGRGVLQLGEAGGGIGPPIGTPTSALVGPANTGSLSRPPPEQQVFLVGYEPDNAKSVSFLLTSSAATPRVLHADPCTGAVTAQPPAPIPPSSVCLSTNLLDQVFNIVVVPASAAVQDGSRQTGRPERTTTSRRRP